MSASLVRKSRKGKDTFYIVAYSYTFQDGVRTRQARWISLGHISVAEAKRELATFISGNAPIPKKMTVADLLTMWQENRRQVSLRTKSDQQKLIDRHIVPALGHYLLSKCTPLDFDLFLNSLTKDGARKDGKTGALGYSARRQIFQVLRQAFRWARKRGVCQDFLADLDAPQRGKDDSEHRPLLTEEQFLFLSEAIHDDPLSPFVDFLYLTGLRISEAIGLRWTDLEGTTLRVQRQLYLGEGIAPKTASSNRSFDLEEEALAVLQTVKARQDAMRELLGNAYQDSGYIFTNGYGGALDDSNVRKAFRRLGRRAGLPTPFSPHQLRRTFTTVMMEHGADPLAVSQLLGHTSTQMTNRYAGQLKKRKAEASALIAKTLSKRYQISQD